MKSIQQQLQEISQRSAQKAEQVVRASVMDVGNRVVIRSPVDTGAFRASWLAGVGAPENKGGSIAQAASDWNLSGGQTLYFTNSLPYAERLEYGWSEQAPTGMVRISAAEFDTIAERMIKAFA